MYLIIGIAVLLILSIIGIKKVSWRSPWNTVFFTSILITSIAEAVMVIVLIVNHISAGGTIANYESIKRSIENSRVADMSEVERANLTNTIIEVNKEIASNKYWNETIFDIFIPDKVTELEELQ